MEALRHLQRGGERLHNRLLQFQHLFMRLIAVESGLNRSAEVEHRPRHLQLDVFKPGRRHALAERQVEDIQKIHCRAQVQFQWAASYRKADSAVEHRVFQQPGLDQICLGHAQLSVHRLQVPIVQQRHLDRPVSSQRVLQQRSHFLAPRACPAQCRGARPLVCRCALRPQH